MVTLETADNALKTVYLGVVSNQLNVNVNPLLSKIKQSSADVWGKEIRKLAPFGINGGIGSGTELGALPTASQNQYVQFVLTLKNLYGSIEISDKAIRASEHNSGAFVNLLNAEMEGLVKASAFNLGRMLYGDSTGFLADVVSHTANTNTITVGNTKNIIEGMLLNVYSTTSAAIINATTEMKVTYVDRVNNIVYLASNYATALTSDHKLVLQGSLNNELTGLGSIFKTTGSLYGVSKTDYKWMVPFIKSSAGAISESMIQEALDFLEETNGSQIDMITCSSDVRRAYQSYMGAYRRNIDVMELAGGFKAITYNGIPVVSDRFVQSGEMYLLNTKDFVLHQLCDWQWLEGDNGKVIKQKEGYPSYSATLVKYADLICDRPCGQAKISGITASTTTSTSEEINPTTE